MNKIIVSIVLAIILVLGIGKITDVIYYVEKPEKSAYQVESITTVASTSSETGSGTASSQNIMALFASTSAADGAKVFKKCAACHSINQEGQIRLVQLYGEFLEGRLVLLRNTSTPKQWLHMKKTGHLKKWMDFY